MVAKDPRRRAELAREAAQKRWAKLDDDARSDATASARDAARRKFADTIDPEGVLRLVGDNEATRVVDSALTENMAHLAKRSATARRRRSRERLEALADETICDECGRRVSAA